MGQIIMKIKQMVDRLEMSNDAKSSLSKPLQTRTDELDEGLDARDRKMLSKVLNKLELIEKVVENQSEILSIQDEKLKTLETTIQHAHDALQTLNKPSTVQDLEQHRDQRISLLEQIPVGISDSATETSTLLQEHSKTLQEHEERLNAAIDKIQNLWDMLHKGPTCIVAGMKEMKQLRSLIESLREKHNTLKTESHDELQLQQKLLDNLLSGFIVAFILLVVICMFHK